MQERELVEAARAAAAGDRPSAERVLDAVQGPVYRLALRMLGHPADAEDATQEILLVILTHLGTFRGESSFLTWAWRVAANHLLRFRRGRREAALTFEVLAERLDTGLRPDPPPVPEAEAQLFAREVRLRCTQAMLLGLDRQSRVAYVLGDILGLAGEDAAAVLEVPPALYRKRLSRARERLYEFMRARCGVYDPANRCRCRGQVECALEREVVARGEPLLAEHPVEAGPAPDLATLETPAAEVARLFRVAEVLRDHPAYAAPGSVVSPIRELLRSGRLELLRC